MNILMNLGPLIASVIAFLFLKEKVKIYEFWFMLIAFLGTVLIGIASHQKQNQPQSNFEKYCSDNPDAAECRIYED